MMSKMHYCTFLFALFTLFNPLMRCVIVTGSYPIPMTSNQNSDENNVKTSGEVYRAPITTHSPGGSTLTFEIFGTTEVTGEFEKPGATEPTIPAEHSQGSAAPKIIQPCQPLIPKVDTLVEGFPWELLLRSAGQPPGERCEPGIELQVTDPSSSSNESMGFDKVRQVHCWIDESCSSSIEHLEPPTGCQFLAIVNQPLINVTWFRTPYGVLPSGYQIRWLALQPALTINHIKPEVMNIKLATADAWGEGYVVQLTGLLPGQAYELSVGSRTTNGTVIFHESCSAVVIIGAGDGSWSQWSEWSPCTAQCASTPGVRTRIRSCNSPPPSNNGRYCTGSSQMQLTCFGEDINC